MTAKLRYNEFKGAKISRRGYYFFLKCNQQRFDVKKFADLGKNLSQLVILRTGHKDFALNFSFTSYKLLPL